MLSEILALAKEGTAYFLIGTLLVLGLKLIKEYPVWKNSENEHEIKQSEHEFRMKELENSKERENSEMIAKALADITEALHAVVSQMNNNTTVVSSFMPVLDRMDKRCEYHGKKLTKIGMKLGSEKVSNSEV